MPNRLIRNIIKDRTLLTAPATMSVRSAAARMADARVGSILVVDEDGAPCGIFTERDLLNRVVAPAKDLDTTPLADVMTPDPQTVPADRTFGYAMHLMATHGCRHIPVIENGRPVGMVTSRDALGSEMIELQHDIETCENIAERL